MRPKRRDSNTLRQEIIKSSAARFLSSTSIHQRRKASIATGKNVVFVWYGALFARGITENRNGETKRSDATVLISIEAQLQTICETTTWLMIARPMARTTIFLGRDTQHCYSQIHRRPYLGGTRSRRLNLARKSPAVSSVTACKYRKLKTRTKYNKKPPLSAGLFTSTLSKLAFKSRKLITRRPLLARLSS